MESVTAEAYATGEEINQICLRLEPLLADCPPGHAIIAMLSLVIIMQNPSITPEELQGCLDDVSKYICLRIDGTGKMKEELRLMN